MRLSVPDPAVVPDLGSVDLLDPGYYATGDAHSVWLHLRRQRPCYWHESPDGTGFWVVTRYAEVCRVLKNHHEFTSERGTMLCIVNLPDIAAGQMMAVTDPPRHTRMREPLVRALNMRAIQAQRPRLVEIAGQLLEPGLSGEPWDFAASALLFPMAFTGVLMGLDPASWHRLAELTTMSIAYTDDEFAEGPPRATLRQAHHELFAYFAEEIARRRDTAPGTDLIGTLMTMEADGTPLTDEEIIFNCYSLLLGANVTTPHTASAMMLALAERPDEYDRWAAHPKLLDSGVEEGLRWSSPANHFMRYAVRDIEICGETIRAGQPVTAWLGSANRDEDVFADPFRYDVARRPNRHVAFGFGPHYCIGAPLARLSLRVLFEQLLRDVRRVELAGPVAHLESNFVAGIKHLPVRLVPRNAGSPVAARRAPLAHAVEP